LEVKDAQKEDAKILEIMLGMETTVGAISQSVKIHVKEAW
jgi:hypothetical protein